MFCVYTTYEPTTGRYYVGKTSTDKIARGYQGSGLWVKRALKKGRTLKTEILSVWADEEEAYDAEDFVVTMCKSDKLCKNIATGGWGGVLGAKRSEETKARMSVALIPHLERVRTAPGYKAQRSASQRAMWADPVYRAKGLEVLARARAVSLNRNKGV